PFRSHHLKSNLITQPRLAVRHPRLSNLRILRIERHKAVTKRDQEGSSNEKLLSQVRRETPSFVSYQFIEHQNCIRLVRRCAPVLKQPYEYHPSPPDIVIGDIRFDG